MVSGIAKSPYGIDTDDPTQLKAELRTAQRNETDTVKKAMLDTVIELVDVKDERAAQVKMLELALAIAYLK
jgi:hypothetical protein